MPNGKSEALSKRQQRNFLDFIASLGIEEHGVLAIHKLMWLQSKIDSPRPPTFEALYQLGKRLSTLGPRDQSLLAAQTEIVRAFTFAAKSGRKLAPPTPPSPAMPENTMRKIVQSINLRTWRGKRLRAGLLLAWRTSISTQNMRFILPSWIEDIPEGKILHNRGGIWGVARDIPILRAEDPELCAVDALSKMLVGAPDLPDVYVFPRLYTSHQVVWSEPMPQDSLIRGLQRALRAIGENQKGYDFTSIRRSCLKRFRDQLGANAALYVAGYKHPRSLNSFLRREPSWKEKRSLFD